MSNLSMSLDEEVRLYSTNAEREKYNLLATLFGIVVALDYLERAYVRDSITAAEYAIEPSTTSSQNTNDICVKEIFARMYKASVAVQDDVQIGWG